jgi:NDP-mannose synthase
MARAVILAGGLGTRLKPYTLALPKPLMPIGDKPILEIIIRQLCRQGFRRVTLAVNHQADLLKAYFGDGSRWRLQIDYCLEMEPLSTIAPLRLIGDLPENFLVMNGDILTDLSYDKFLEQHIRGDYIFTISAAAREQKVDYGVLEVGSGQELQGFHEKPSIPYLVSMGVYCVNRRILEHIPPERSYGFDQLMKDLLKKRIPVRVEPYDGYWLDIGRPDDYHQAIEEWPRMASPSGE